MEWTVNMRIPAAGTIRFKAGGSPLTNCSPFLIKRTGKVLHPLNQTKTSIDDGRFRTFQPLQRNACLFTGGYEEITESKAYRYFVNWVLIIIINEGQCFSPYSATWLTFFVKPET
jgi:hypothetical protein